VRHGPQAEAVNVHLTPKEKVAVGAVGVLVAGMAIVGVYWYRKHTEVDPKRDLFVEPMRSKATPLELKPGVRPTTARETEAVMRHIVSPSTATVKP